MEPNWESRRARRIPHLGRVLFRNDVGFKGQASLQDPSTTGCRVVSESPLQVGMELELFLCVATHERDIEIELAKVRWANGTCFGLEFLAIYPPERERLRLFLKAVVVGTAAPLRAAEGISPSPMDHLEHSMRRLNRLARLRSRLVSGRLGSLDDCEGKSSVF